MLRTASAAVLASLLTALLLGAGSAQGAGPSREPVPILMYHVVADAPVGTAYPDLWVRPADFRGQMAWLDRHGYRAVTLTAVWNHWHRGTHLPEKPVVVTFDDGFHSDVKVALPTLLAHRWPGVLNLALSHLGRDRELRPRGVRRLLRAGWELASHSATHPDLTAVGAAQLTREVAGSRSTLRREFAVPVNFFCYPAGRYDGRVVAAVRAAGYLGATTTEYGLGRPNEPFTLARVRVNGSDGVAGLASKLTSIR